MFIRFGKGAHTTRGPGPAWALALRRSAWPALLPGLDVCHVAATRWHAQVHAGLASTGRAIAKDGKFTRRPFPEAAACADAAGAGRRWRIRDLCMTRGLAALLLLGSGATTKAADLASGQTLYRTHCANCHGPGGRPVLPGAPDLSRPTALLRPDLSLLSSIRNGKGGMPGYAGQLRDREILDLVAHMRTFR